MHVLNGSFFFLTPGKAGGLGPGARTSLDQQKVLQA